MVLPTLFHNIDPQNIAISAGPQSRSELTGKIASSLSSEGTVLCTDPNISKLQHLQLRSTAAGTCRGMRFHLERDRLLEYKAFSSDAFTGLLKCSQAMALYLARPSVFKKQQEPRKRGSNTPSKGGGGHLKTLAWHCKKYRLEKNTRTS